MITSFHISGTQAGFISTITNLGMLIEVFFGIIADKYGRVKVFSQTVLLFSIASLLMYFASNIYLVYLFRFIAGVGAGGEYGACMSLISESFQKTNWTSFFGCWYWCAGRCGFGCDFSCCDHSNVWLEDVVCRRCTAGVDGLVHSSRLD